MHEQNDRQKNNRWPSKEPIHEKKPTQQTNDAKVKLHTRLSIAKILKKGSETTRLQFATDLQCPLHLTVIIV